MSELRTVEAFVVGTVKDVEVLRDIPGCPLDAAAVERLLAHCPAYVIDPNGETPNYLQYTEPRPSGLTDMPGLWLWQPGPAHNRSFVLGGPGLDEPWSDEYGNRYGAFTLKGINFTNPGIMEHPVSTDGVVAWGLQESKIIGRVLKASEVLARRGVDTERIIGLAEPKEFPWPIIDGHTEAHEYIGLREYKQRIVEDYWRELPDAARTVESYTELVRIFSDTTFYVSLRATGTAYRLYDLTDLTALANCFDELNRHHLQPGEQPFDAASPDDRQRYVTEFFAPRVGRNLARLHEDLAHGYPNSLNLTALGGIVDLDSVHGESLGLGDAPVTHEERAQDIVDVLSAIQGSFSDRLVYTKPSERARDAIMNFLQSYFTETIERLGSEQAASEYLGEIICWLGPAIDRKGRSDNDPYDNAMVQLACDAYYDRFYVQRYPGQFAEARDAMSTSAADMLQTDAGLAARLDARLAGSLDIYSGLVVEDRIGDLADPAFDAVAAFMAEPRNTTAWDAILGDISQEILAHCMQSASLRQYLPRCIQQIESPIVREMMITGFIGHFLQDIGQHAAGVAEARLAALEPGLRDGCAYTRPESVLPGHNSQPYVGLEPKQFLLDTQGVSLQEVLAFLKTANGTITIGRLLHPPREGVTVRIGASDAVTEIVSLEGTDGAAVDTTGNELVMDLFFGGRDVDYVLLVGKTPGGLATFKLLLRDPAGFHAANDPTRYVQDALEL